MSRLARIRAWWAGRRRRRFCPHCEVWARATDVEHDNHLAAHRLLERVRRTDSSHEKPGNPQKPLPRRAPGEARPAVPLTRDEPSARHTPSEVCDCPKPPGKRYYHCAAAAALTRDGEDQAVAAFRAAAAEPVDELPPAPSAPPEVVALGCELCCERCRKCAIECRCPALEVRDGVAWYPRPTQYGIAQYPLRWPR